MVIYKPEKSNSRLSIVSYLSPNHLTVEAQLSVRFSDSVIISPKLNGLPGLELFVSGELSAIPSRSVHSLNSHVFVHCCSHSSF